MARTHLLLLLLIATAGLSLADPANAQTLECRYAVIVSDAAASELSVTIECDGGLPARFAMKSGAAGWAGAMTLSDGSALKADADGWTIPSGSRDGTAHYRIALGAMSDATGGHMAALKTGDSILVKLDSWLAVPAPTGNYTLALAFEFPAGGDVAAALPRHADGYRIAAGDVRRAGHFVLGTFRRAEISLPAPRALIDGTGGTSTVNLVILGRSMKSTTTDLTRWVEYSGLAVAEFFGGFPMADSFIVILPVTGDQIDRGSVVPGRAVTTIIQIGRSMPPEALYADKVLIHEMIHLGSPDIDDRGDWLNEGVATYYEWIVPLRAGWIAREDVWRQWLRRMPRGLDAMGPVGLEDAEGSGVYWGGVLFLLLADIELRQATGLARGVEDCVRAARDAGGTMDREWTTQKFLDLCDETLGGTTLNDLAKLYLGPGEPPILNALWARLGVSRTNDGTILFNDNAPLAAVRDAILEGGPDARWQPVPRDGAPALDVAAQSEGAAVSGTQD